MKTLNCLHCPKTLLVFCCMLLTAVSAPADHIKDPLNRSAMISALAPNSTLLSITMAGRRVIAAGERGIIVYSDDNGDSWAQAKVPVSVTLTNLFFASQNKGWAVGHSGVVLHSDDSGESWVKQLDGEEAVLLMLEDANAKAAAAPESDEKIQRQLINAKLFAQDGPDKPFLDVYFRNESEGFIIGAYNMIFYTSNGGKTWKPWLEHAENPDGLHLYGIRPVGDYLFIAGERGLFLRSEDRGQSFHLLSTPYEGSFFGLIAIPKQRLIIFGLKGNTFRSSDLGETWQAVETGVHMTITGATRLCDGTCLLTTQYGDVLISKDQGETFSKLDIKGDTYPFMDATETSNGNIVLVGTRGVKVIEAPLNMASSE